MEEANNEVQSTPAENINLGPNIELSGFREVERSSMPVIRKIVGNGVRVISEKASGFERMKITLKKVHGGHGSYEVNGEAIIGGNAVNASSTHINLFYALSDIMNKIEAQL